MFVCPCCGAALVALPSGQIVQPSVVAEVAELIDAGDEVLHQALNDPDRRAVLGEHLMIEELGLDDLSQPE